MNPFLVPIIAIIFGCLIAIFGIIFSYFEKKKQYEAMARMVEAGKNPEEIKELLAVKSKKVFDPYCYLKRGIITISLGLGILAFGLIINTDALTGIGIFILFLGVAFLVIHFLLKNKK